ncbi:MAG: SGNH/GDSL hydrolase family protein [Armatimonadota bacterium]
MELTYQQIQAIASGCQQVVEADSAWQFLRCPEELAAAHQENPGAIVRMECPAGVRLRFVSDTTTLRLGLRYGAAARDYFQGVVLIDGCAQAFGPTEYTERWEGQIVAGPKQERLFDIWLPHLVRADLESLAIDDGSALQPAPPPSVRWLAYGDSITQGMTVPLPTQTFFARCALDLQLDIRNLAFGGAQLEALYADLRVDYPHDISSIAFGTNDLCCDVPLAAFTEYAKGLLDHLHAVAPGRPILLVTPIPWAGRTEPNGLGLTLEDYRTALRPLAGYVPECRLIEGDELIDNDGSLFVDNVHPNEAGMAMYAHNLTNIMREALLEKANEK